MLEELERVLLRQAHVPSESVHAFLTDLRLLKIVPTPPNPSSIPVRDPDDALVLASALEAKADILVTGDKDLLVLGDKAGIKIVDPRTLWDILGKE